jgi:hypothetical protein
MKSRFYDWNKKTVKVKKRSDDVIEKEWQKYGKAKVVKS